MRYWTSEVEVYTWVNYSHLKSCYFRPKRFLNDSEGPHCSVEFRRLSAHHYQLGKTGLGDWLLTSRISVVKVSTKVNCCFLMKAMTLCVCVCVDWIHIEIEHMCVCIISVIEIECMCMYMFNFCDSHDIINDNIYISKF